MLLGEKITVCINYADYQKINNKLQKLKAVLRDSDALESAMCPELKSKEIEIKGMQFGAFEKNESSASWSEKAYAYALDIATLFSHNVVYKFIPGAMPQISAHLAIFGFSKSLEKNGKQYIGKFSDSEHKVAFVQNFLDSKHQELLNQIHQALSANIKQEEAFNILKEAPEMLSIAPFLIKKSGVFWSAGKSIASVVLKKTIAYISSAFYKQSGQNKDYEIVFLKSDEERGGKNNQLTVKKIDPVLEKVAEFIGLDYRLIDEIVRDINHDPIKFEDASIELNMPQEIHDVTP